MKLVGNKIIHLSEVDSTNLYVSRLMKENKIESGTVVYADIQSSGRGQRQKEWVTEPYANLLMSVAADLNLWKIKNLISLNHIVAIAVFRFLSKYTDGVRIKWPNDVMINDKKIVGILIENQLSSSSRRSVIGLGININQKEFTADRSTSLSLEAKKDFIIEDLLFEMMESLESTVLKYQQKGEEYFYELYNKHLWKRGEEHLFYQDEEVRTGIIQKTTMEGQLEVLFGEEIEHFSNGEVKH